MADTLFGRGVLAEIQGALREMPDALSRVGSYIVGQPEAAIRASMADIALQCGSGEASIVRFCRQMGFAGFRELKIALASDIAYQRSYETRGSSALADRMITALKSTSDTISEVSLRRVGERLVAARHIDVFGSGVSGIVAELFAYRFSRLGLVARAFQDPVLADEVAGARGGDSVVIAISETGLTLPAERFLTQARAAGAFTVAISGRQFGGLEELCDVVFVATPVSPLPQRGEMSPVAAKLFICDLLAQEVMLALGDRTKAPASK